jgi:hypothetical protein
MPAVLAGAFFLWAMWLHMAVLGRSDILLGAPGSDALRGIWSMHHAAIYGPLGLWTDRVFYPTGVFVLPLPLFSSTLLAPLFWLFSPITAYNTALVFLLALDGLAAAWLCREWTDRWWPGAIAGVAACSQPLLFHAITDGTPEHLSLWPLLAAAAAGLRALRSGERRWAVACAFFLLALPFDAPYAIVFGAVLLPIVWAADVRRALLRDGLGRALRTTWPAWLVLVLGAFTAQWVYSAFSFEEPGGPIEAAALMAGNSVNLVVWSQFIHTSAPDSLGTLAPAYLSQAFVFVTVGLAFLAPRSNAPWLLAALASLTLALGVQPANTTFLAQHWGETGRAIGDTVMATNQYIGSWALFEHIRFPRRWLVITGICLGQAAACGARGAVESLQRRVFSNSRPAAWKSVIAALVAFAATHLVAGSAEVYRHHLPTFRVPDVKFAAWIKAQPGEGAVVLFPTLRPAPAIALRGDRPVYANLPRALAGGDEVLLQVLHGRPVYSYPALQTLVPLGKRLTDVHRVIRDVDDLAASETVPTHIQTRLKNRFDEDSRADALAQMHQIGIRWLVFDRSVYADGPLALGESLFAPVTLSRQEFDDGDGVVVLEVGN